MKPRSLTLPALAALTVLLGLAHLPARAIGRLADVTIVDRDTGATLPVHYARGEYWVAGRPGARYGITVRNRLGERVLAVVGGRRECAQRRNRCVGPARLCVLALRALPDHRLAQERQPGGGL